MLRGVLRWLGIRTRTWGDWQGLESPSNLARYHAIERLRQTYVPDGSIVDLGCGAGEVLRHCADDVPYLGIDLQPAAIAAAQTHRRGPWHVVRCGDIANRAPLGDQRFDLILFNEVLYYQPTVAHALQLVDAYCAHLTPNGLILVSIWIETAAPHRLNGPIWSAIDAQDWLHRVDGAYVPDTTGRGWHIGLYRPRSH